MSTSKEIQDFFDLPVQRHFARRWTAEDVDRLQNPTAKDEFPIANAQARKLRTLLADASRTASTQFTYGAADAIMAHEMGEAGFESLYQSGANATLAEVPTFDCGGDLADYTYDTLPKRVKQIVQNQLHWARVDRVRAKNEAQLKDRLVPIIADGDSGHGNVTATMKLVKLFLDAGAAAIHIDDLLSGEKNFSVGSLTHVLVPTSEHRRRLLAAKLQLDIYQSHVVLIARTDSESASRITSAIDPLDRPYILGRTKLGGPSLYSILFKSKARGAERYAEELEWEKSAILSTLDGAVHTAAPHRFSEWSKATQGMNVADALSVAHEIGLNVEWDADGCRNERGWYRYKGGIEAAIARSIAFADYGDMVWSCAPGYRAEDVRRFAKELQEARPGKWMGYNWSFGLFEDKTDEETSALVKQVGSLGYVWQFNPQAGFYEHGVAMNRFARQMHKDHLLPYVRSVREGMRENVSAVDWYELAGDLSDFLMDSVQ